MKYKNLEEISRELVSMHKKLNSIINDINAYAEKEKKKLSVIEKYKEQSKIVSEKIRELEKELI